MTERDTQIESLLGRIETAAGEIPDPQGANAALITEIVQAVNGLRSLLGADDVHKH